MLYLIILVFLTIVACKKGLPIDTGRAYYLENGLTYDQAMKRMAFLNKLIDQIGYVGFLFAWLALSTGYATISYWLVGSAVLAIIVILTYQETQLFFRPLNFNVDAARTESKR